MSPATLCHKLTADEQRRREVQVRMAVNCREAARRNPAIAQPLRAKMRVHALQALGRLVT